MPRGDVVRFLGPTPDEAATSVDPLVKLDRPLDVIQAVLGGICTSAGELVRPIEILLVDPRGLAPGEVIPVAALVDAWRSMPELYVHLPIPAGLDWIRAAFGEAHRVAPLLYCRKLHTLFAARSSRTGKPLTAIAGDHAGDGEGVHAAMSTALLSTDADGSDDEKAIRYGGTAGDCALGPVRSFDELIMDQGAIAADDPVAHDRLCAQHACCGCDERRRCYPENEGYAYALDRLSLVSATEMRLLPLPLGEWRLREALDMLGRVRPSQAVTAASEESGNNAFEIWRRERATAMERSGPLFLLSDEQDGRELLEICRLKLGLICDVLGQLDAVWRASRRSHLCWNADTIRVAWLPPSAAPAACWGLRGLLRKWGLQPATDVKNAAGQTLTYPPVFSDEALLAEPVVEAMRYFEKPGKAGLYVKNAKPSGEETADVHVLLEDTGIPRRLFSTADDMRIDGQGWTMVLSPAAEHNPDDGEGVPFVGVASGNVAKLKAGEQFGDCGYLWRPRFGEACDLYVLGMSLFEALLSHDKRSPQRLRETIVSECDELQRLCLALEIENRSPEAATWVAARCDNDAPASLWSRRNLLHLRDERSAARLDGLPPLLWQAVMMLGFRMTTSIPGFSYCADRGCDAPRMDSGDLLPLVELRGLLGLFDDLIFGRRATVARLRSGLSES